eukprot:1954446-Alexandrium_andersonii.AAC.1
MFVWWILAAARGRAGWGSGGVPRCGQPERPASPATLALGFLPGLQAMDLERGREQGRGLEQD